MTAPNSTMIRHEGRAHIRGKIRRIWRPRYLQLTDSGFVRYFELTTSTTSLEPPGDDPKFTLQIYHARIIDVTTFRDLHVGLPKGTYGFCFHGRRLLLNPVVVDDTACHPPENFVPPPRDYFCAVATLEEAQSWVVALQWAATVPNNNNNNDFGVWDPVMDYPTTNYEQHEDYFYALRKHNALQVIDNSSSLNYSSPVTSKARSTRTTSTKETPVSGKVVVTKVRQHRVVCVERWNRLEIAYDIQLLLLRSTKKSSKKWTVEERMVVRTRQDLQLLLEQLRSDTGLSSKKAAKDTTTTTLTQVDELLKEMDKARSIQKSISLVDSALRKLAMDGAVCNSKPLRQFWCIAATTVAPPLPSSTTWQVVLLQDVLDWPRLHDSHALWNKSSMETTTRKNPNDLVKQWLQQEETTTTKTAFQVTSWHGCLYWIMNHEQLFLATLAALLVLLYPVLGVYQSFMVSLRIRLDLLLLSWAVSFVFGSGWRNHRFEHTVANRQIIMSPPVKVSSTTIVATAETPKTQEEPSFEEEASMLEEEEDSLLDGGHSTTSDEEQDDDDEGVDDEYDDIETTSTAAAADSSTSTTTLSSPLPQHPANNGVSCWSKPEPQIFRVRGVTYLTDRIKVPSAREPFVCRGVDVWLTDNPERHIARHPSVCGGKLGQDDTFVVNFLLPFGNFVAYFAIPPLNEFPDNLRQVWSKFIKGDQQYRDARLKLLPVVVDGPWIVKKAVGPGTSPALLGKVIPLQYYFSGPTDSKKGIYEVDIIITASRIAKGILSVVKGHTNALTIAFAFIIEAAEEAELPETVLCTFQLHALELERCPQLPEYSFDEV